MWGTIVRDVYGIRERGDLAEAIEELFTPSGEGWSTAGVYAYFDPETLDLLYVGKAIDQGLRFRQHNGLRSADPNSCKWGRIEPFLAARGSIGLALVAWTGADRPLTSRSRKIQFGRLDDDAEMSAAAVTSGLGAEIASLEGKLLALHEAQNGRLPYWNDIGGLLTPPTPDPSDGTITLLTGARDCHLVARRSIRQVGRDDFAWASELDLHMARALAVAFSILDSGGYSDALVLDALRILDSHGAFPFDGQVEAIKTYLES